MILRWRCLIESESGAMGPASIVNDLQPEQTEKSGLHNLTLKAYSLAYACYTSKRLINLPLISPTSLSNCASETGGGFFFFSTDRLRSVRQPSDLPDRGVRCCSLACRRLPICIPLHTLCNRKAAPKRCQVTHRIKLDCVFSCSPAFNGLISLLNILRGARRVGII